MTGPLDGVLVVSIDQAVAAPFTTSRLADAGARVIKVERPGGDFARRYDTVAGGESAYFVWLNRGKESIELDIKEPADAALLRRMIARADVFIQNLAPGAAARAGFGSEELRQAHPRLITCDISGYNEDGPYRDMKAYDLLVQGESGLASITGTPESPGRVGVSVCDIATGLYALAGILEALYERQRTGYGKGLKVTLFDAMADWMNVPLIYQDCTGQGPSRVGLNHPSIAPYGAYAAGDGKQLILSIQNEREWQSFCEIVLERPELARAPEYADNEARVRHRANLDREIAAAFDTLDRPALIERLRRARVAYGLLNSVAELSQHPELRRVPIDTPGGRVDLAASPIRFTDDDGAFGPVPASGAQSEALRAEFAESSPEVKEASG